MSGKLKMDGRSIALQMSTLSVGTWFHVLGCLLRLWVCKQITQILNVERAALPAISSAYLSLSCFFLILLLSFHPVVWRKTKQEDCPVWAAAKSLQGALGRCSGGYSSSS